MFIEILNILGTIAFAISGGLKGLKYHLDILGVMILGIMVAVGGGIVRDMILNKVPEVFIKKEVILIAIVTTFLTFILGRTIENYSRIIKFFDAIGLAVFTIIGSKIAIDFNLSIIGVIFIATITATAGGVIRDMLVKEIPFILKEEIYATFCIIGSLIYYTLLRNTNLNEEIISYVIIIFIFVGRLLAVRFDLHMPRRKIGNI